MIYMGLKNNVVVGWSYTPIEGYLEVDDSVYEIASLHPDYIWDGTTLVAPPEPPPYVPTPEEIIAMLQQAVQANLDAMAQRKHYDDMKSLRASKGSVDPEFDADGIAGDAYWAGCWRTCYTVMAEVEAGTRPIPTAEELVAMLPVAPW